MISRRQYLFHKVTNAVLWSLLISVDLLGLAFWLLGLLAGAASS